jgi:RNA polymerase sigma-70 factor (ECF subfamily)
MTDDLTVTRLRRHLETNYLALKQRIARDYASEDFATEVLHETWLRLERAQSTTVRNLEAYIVQTANSIAISKLRRERGAPIADTGAIIETASGEITPLDALEAQALAARLGAALADLPPRRRAIFALARQQGLSQEAIAGRFGISTRMVRKELAAAIAFCRKRVFEGD